MRSTTSGTRPRLNPLRGPGARAQTAVPSARSGCAGEMTEADRVLHSAGQVHADGAGIRDAARCAHQRIVRSDLAIADADRDGRAARAGSVLRGDPDVPCAVKRRCRSRRGQRDSQKKACDNCGAKICHDVPLFGSTQASSHTVTSENVIGVTPLDSTPLEETRSPRGPPHPYRRRQDSRDDVWRRQEIRDRCGNRDARMSAVTAGVGRWPGRCERGSAGASAAPGIRRCRAYSDLQAHGLGCGLTSSQPNTE
jgi:hypothetical protein